MNSFVHSILSFLLRSTLSTLSFIALALIVWQHFPAPGGIEFKNPEKDLIPLPSYARYVPVTTEKDIILNVIEAKDPNVKQPQPLLMFLHGFPESAWITWHSQIAFFASQGYHVIAPDQRGYNDSSKPKDPFRRMYTPYGKITDDAVALLKHFLTPNKKATIVGHDWGGVVAWSVASNYPDLVSKLVVLNAPHSGAIRSLSLIEQLETLQFLRSWYMFYFQLPVLPEQRMLEGDGIFFMNWGGLLQLGSHGYIGKPVLSKYRQIWYKPGAATSMIDWYRGAFRDIFIPSSLKHNNPRAKCKVPTLILWGKKDSFLHYLLATKSFDFGLDDSVKASSKLHFIADANHWVTHMASDVVNTQIFSFIQGGNTSIKGIKPTENEAKKQPDVETVSQQAEIDTRSMVNDITARNKAEEAKKKAEEKISRKKRAEEAARKKSQEKEAARKKNDEKIKLKEDVVRKKKEEENAARKRVEEEVRKKAEEEIKHKQAEESRRKQQEEEAKRKVEQEAKRQQAGAETRFKAEEEAKRKAEEQKKREAQVKKIETKLATEAKMQESVISHQQELEREEAQRDKRIINEEREKSAKPSKHDIDLKNIEKKLQYEAQNQEIQFEHEKDMYKLEDQRDKKILEEVLTGKK